jgi:hypothetical protein
VAMLCAPVNLLDCFLIVMLDVPSSTRNMVGPDGAERVTNGCMGHTGSQPDKVHETFLALYSIQQSRPDCSAGGLMKLMPYPLQPTNAHSKFCAS